MIAKQVKEFRLRAGLSQQEMADLLFLDRVRYTMCEIGKRPFPKWTEKVVEALQKSLEIAENNPEVDEINKLIAITDWDILFEIEHMPGQLQALIKGAKRKLKKMEKEFPRNCKRYNFLLCAYDKEEDGKIDYRITEMYKRVEKKLQKNSPLQQEKLKAHIELLEARLAIVHRMAERLLPPKAA